MTSDAPTATDLAAQWSLLLRGMTGPADCGCDFDKADAVSVANVLDQLRAELESARTVLTHVDTWRHGGGEPGYDAAQAVIDAYDEHAGREFAAGSKPTVVLTGDTGGGRREFGIHVGGRDLGGFGYQDCGWAFQEHKPIIRDLAEALGAQVDDRTT